MKSKLLSIIICLAILLSVIPQNVISVQAQSTCGYSEPDDGLGGSIISPGVYNLTSCAAYDIDFYPIAVKAGDDVYLTLTNLQINLDLTLFVLNKSKNEITKVAYSTNFDMNNEKIMWTATNDDILYIQISPSVNQNFNTSIPYTLTFKKDNRVNLGSSAETENWIRSQLKSINRFPDSDLDKLVYLVKYAKNAKKCVDFIRNSSTLGATLQVYKGYKGLEGCGKTFTEINRVLSKFITPDPVGGIAGCQDIYFSKTISGSISDTSDRVYYCFEVGGSQWITARMFTTTSGLDPMLDIYNLETGQFIWGSDDGKGIGWNSFLPIKLPQGGIYLMTASRYGLSTGSYRLRLEDGASAAAGDVNKDCTVNDKDLQLAQNALGTNKEDYDIDLSGSVDTRDLTFLVRNKGTSCAR